MSEFFASGRAADLLIAVLALEAAVLLLWLKRRDLLVALLPGLCLVLALRAALTGAGWGVVALWLAASLPAHIWDMRRRLRGP